MSSRDTAAISPTHVHVRTGHYSHVDGGAQLNHGPLLPSGAILTYGTLLTTGAILNHSPPGF